MKGLAILILVVIFFWLIWPTVSRYLKRKAMEKAEDYVRRSMGMPPRDKKNSRSAQDSYYQKQRRNQQNNPGNKKEEPLIPKEYAEDVEFVEIKDYSETTYHKKADGTKIYHESQITDVEWTEVQKSRGK